MTLLRPQGKGYSLANMAELLGVGRGKVQAWERGQKPHADDLAAMSQVLGLDPAWLLMGEGEPERDKPAAKAKKRFTAVNQKKQLIGDLLHEALALLEIDHISFAKTLRITPEQAEEILASRRKPTWDELAKIHTAYHVDIHFLLTGNGDTFIPHDLFTRLCAATGIEPWNTSALADACRCDKDEMAAWVKEWNSGKEPFFPPDWMAAVVEQFSINPGWLYQGRGQSHLSMDEVRRQLAASTGYRIRETYRDTPRAQEPQAAYADPKKAAGDDSD